MMAIIVALDLETLVVYIVEMCVAIAFAWKTTQRPTDV